MAAESPAAKLIDALLAAPKELAGTPSWQPTGDPGEMRLTWPVMVNGEIPPGVTVAINYYPNANPQRYSISLNAPKSVYRVDWDSQDEQYHPNSASRPKGLPASVTGPHVHAWVDNRHFCTAHSLPSTLLNANYLPEQLRTFEHVLRWFLGQVGIAQPANDLIQPPTRSTLLI